MGYCETHDLEFNMTCPACDHELNYMQRTHLLDAFRAGVRGKTYTNGSYRPPYSSDSCGQTSEYVAAWNDGLNFCKRKSPVGNTNDKKRYSKGKKLSEGDTNMAGKKKATTTKPDTDISFEQMLGEATVASSTPKKGDKPIIKLDADMSVKFLDFLRYKKEYKAAEGNMRAAEGPLLEFCIDRQDTDGLKDDFHGSYTVISADGKTSATFITQDKFSPSQEAEDQETLKTILGDKYATEVIKTSTVILRPEVFEDETLKKELVAKMGADFSKFFMTTHKYSMKEGFGERLYRIANSMANLIRLRTICGKAKPYIK